MSTSFWKLTWKISLIIVTCYLSIAVIIHYLRPVKYTTSEAEPFLNLSARVILRPVMDLAASKRLSIITDWKANDTSNLEELNRNGVLLRANNSEEKVYYNFDTYNWFNHFANPQLSIIVEPVENQTQPWTLVRCEAKNDGKCQEILITIKDKVKTSVFKEETVYFGLNANREIVKLKLLQTINSNQRIDLTYL